MSAANLQAQCEQGQLQLMAMDYLAAEATLAAAAETAWQSADFDTLSRIYLPLQEARRQRRQRCGEGIVYLNLCAHDAAHAAKIIERYRHGQLLIAGLATIEAAVEFRRLQAERNLYVDTFLAAMYYVTDAGMMTFIIPTADAPLPPIALHSLEGITQLLPPHCIALRHDELPRGPLSGTAETYALTMRLWERLHTPFLAAADAVADPRQRIAAYMKVIEVDYACELAHQKLAQTARLLLRPLPPRYQATPDFASDVKIDKEEKP